MKWYGACASQDIAICINKKNGKRINEIFLWLRQGVN
jgi:hypothetical protein